MAYGDVAMIYCQNEYFNGDIIFITAYCYNVLVYQDILFQIFYCT